MSRYSTVQGKRSTLGTKDHVRIYERLKEVIDPAADDGYCFYKPGFSDQVIAIELGYVRSNVEGVRRSVFGKLRPPLVQNVDLSLERRITDIEEFLTRHHPGWNE